MVKEPHFVKAIERNARLVENLRRTVQIVELALGEVPSGMASSLYTLFHALLSN
jgi:hypothetical protein